jgi:3-hydroxyisobutyrate dehydrogenase-like beta-hydroxyacid dehydrogenase
MAHVTGVAIVGLGMIGGGAARALASKGFVVRGHDVRPEAVEALQGVVEGTDSPAAAGDGLEVALVAVMDDAQVRDVLTGAGGLLAAPAPPRVVVILSTVTLDTVRWAAEKGRAHGVAVLDCGVSGGPQALAQASITAMLGGDEAGVAIARPVLEGFADPVVHCGPLGNGMRTKLARNLVTYAQWMVAWEAARLAVAAGVARETFLECVAASDRWMAPPTYFAAKGAGLGDGAAPDPAVALSATYADKDLRAALALAEELGGDAPAAALALARLPAMTGDDGAARAH